MIHLCKPDMLVKAQRQSPLDVLCRIPIRRPRTIAIVVWEAVGNVSNP